MRLLNDPIRSLRLRMRATMAIGFIALIGCTWWTFHPIEPIAASPIDAAVNQPTQPAPQDDASPIQITAFASARLWNPQPAPVQAQPQVAQAPAKPLRLQLIGIIQQADALHAALYDQDADRILIVTSGQKVNDHTVVKISAKTVELSDGQSTHELRLMEAGS